MKMSVLLAGLVMLMSLMATAVFSLPSSLGPTGILNVPTAETVTPGGFELMVAYDRPTVAHVGIDVLPVATLTYGLAHGEIGVSYFNIEGYTAVKSVHAKYIIARQSTKSPGTGGPNIALGAMYMKGDTAETDVYLVASGHTMDLHDGIGTTVATFGLLYQKPNDGGGSGKLTGMAGLEIGTPGKTTLGLDYIVKDIVAGSMFGATLRQPLTRTLTAQVGVGGRNRYFAGLSLKFGAK
ncbi:MAG TPA: hypothetical protein VGL77_12215 [Armatimonadota bacterium]|jgi:hypothetical protein